MMAKKFGNRKTCKRTNWWLKTMGMDYYSGSSSPTPPEPDPIQVTFEGEGTGSALASIANLTPSYPVTGLAAGDIFFCHAAIRNLTTVFETPSGWTLVGGLPDSNNAGNSWLFYKVADGTETGNLTLTTIGDTIDVKLAKIYRFRGAAGSNLFGTNVTNTGSGSTTLSAPTVVGTETLGLAVCFTYESDNNGFTEFTGESGGDWTIPGTNFATSLGADSLLSLQTAVLASPGTISGGSTTMAASASWINRAFVLYRSDIAEETVRSGRLYGITYSQSNGDGEANAADIPGGRPELTQVIPRSYVWWEGPNGVRWQPLEAGVNACTGAGQFGPVISMAYAEHLKYPNEDKYYIIHAVGGSTIAAWNTSLKDQWQAKYDAAIEYITPTEFVGIATFHGESDSASAVGSAAYEAAEDTGISGVFANTGFTRAFVLQVHDSLPPGTFLYTADVQAAKVANEAAGNYGVGGALVSAVGLGVQGDFVHLTAQGYIDAGERMSDVMP